jgi:hypothetical protein
VATAAGRVSLAQSNGKPFTGTAMLVSLDRGYEDCAENMWFSPNFSGRR